MAFTTDLVFDITTQSFITSLTQPSAINTPAWYADDIKHLSITFARRSSANTVSVVSGTGITLQIAIGDPASSPTVDTSATAAAADANHAFVADLPLNVAAIQTALGTNDEVTRILEFRTSDASGSQRYQTPIRIKQRLITGTLQDPAAPAVAISGSEAFSSFVPRDGSNTSYPNSGFIMVDSDDTTKKYLVSIRAGQMHVEPLN